MSTELAFGRDYQGINADAPDVPVDIWTATLAGGTHSTVTVPSNYKTWIMYVRAEPDGWVWVSRNGTAAVPAAGTFGAAVSELIPGTIEYRRKVFAADVIDFITPNTTCDISVSFYAVQP